MKRIVIDVTEEQHEHIKQVAARLGVSISNLFRGFVGLPLQKQGARNDLTGKSLAKKSFST